MLVVTRIAAARAADSVIKLQGDVLEVVSQFRHLGSVFASDCTQDAEITHRVAAANRAFQQLRQANIWSIRALTLSVKMQLLQCIVMSCMSHTLERYGLSSNSTLALCLFSRLKSSVAYPCVTMCQMLIYKICARPFLCSLSGKRKDSGEQAKCSGRLMIDCFKSFCLVKSRTSAHKVAPGLVLGMLCCVTVTVSVTVTGVDLIGMLRTNDSGETRMSGKALKILLLFNITQVPSVVKFMRSQETGRDIPVVFRMPEHILYALNLRNGMIACVKTQAAACRVASSAGPVTNQSITPCGLTKRMMTSALLTPHMLKDQICS